MTKKIALLITAAALSLGVVACDGNTNNNANPDLSQQQQNNPDMSADCVVNPMTQVELLNACTTAQSFDKMPFYPTLAPNGVLPPLQ